MKKVYSRGIKSSNKWKDAQCCNTGPTTSPQSQPHRCAVLFCSVLFCCAVLIAALVWVLAIPGRKDGCLMYWCYFTPVFFSVKQICAWDKYHLRIAPTGPIIRFRMLLSSQAVNLLSTNVESPLPHTAHHILHSLLNFEFWYFLVKNFFKKYALSMCLNYRECDWVFGNFDWFWVAGRGGLVFGGWDIAYQLLQATVNIVRLSLSLLCTP